MCFGTKTAAGSHLSGFPQLFYYYSYYYSRFPASCISVSLIALSAALKVPCAIRLLPAASSIKSTVHCLA